MSSNTILSHKKLSLERNVWFVMIVTSILCLGLISYRLIDNKACVPFSISIKSILNNQRAYYEVDETLVFKASHPEQREVTWKFGDETNDEKTASPSMRHKFSKEGTYTVIAIVNGKCTNELRVNVKKGDKNIYTPENTSNASLPRIYGSPSTLTGKPEKYMSDAVGTAYEWRVLDKSTYPIITEQYATFTFIKPGTYTLQLTLDHDRKKQSTMQVMVSDDLAKGKIKKSDIPVLIPADLRVIPFEDKKTEKAAEKPAEKTVEKPTEKPAEKTEITTTEATAKKILLIRNETFKTLLDGVVSGSAEAEDFDKYLFYGGKTPVRINDEKNFKTFNQFCQAIKGKKITIEEVLLLREENNNVQQIRVKYSKKGFLKNIF